jgi:transposase-like protein
VRSSVEETLNAEADQILRCTTARAVGESPGYAGRDERRLETKAGEVKLRVPKLRDAIRRPDYPRGASALAASA